MTKVSGMLELIEEEKIEFSGPFEEASETSRLASLEDLQKQNVFEEVESFDEEFGRETGKKLTWKTPRPASLGSLQKQGVFEEKESMLNELGQVIEV